MPAMHDWAKLAIVLYGVVLLAHQPELGCSFLLSVALVEFVIPRL